MDYTKYITTQHKDKPRYLATVAASVSPFAAVQELLHQLIDGHFIDTAIGKQLDTIGEWVGQSRYLKHPLDDVYFSWDDKVDTGWDSGIWWDTYSPMEGMVELDDESYRYLLKMFIAANRWDSNLNTAYDIWQQTFGTNNFILFTDYQDMSVDITFSGKLPSPVKQMIKAGLQPFKPESVRVRTYFTNNNDGPVFGWDMANNAINGWDTGYWVDEINM